jgi:hypothetical protein
VACELWQQKNLKQNVTTAEEVKPKCNQTATDFPFGNIAGNALFGHCQLHDMCR